MDTSTTTTPPIVTTSGQAQSDFTTYSSQLQNALGSLGIGAKTSAMGKDGADTEAPDYSNYSDNYTRMLEEYGKTADAASNALIKSINARRATDRATVDKTYNNYKNALTLLGIQHNEAQSSPGMLSGHIAQIESEHMAKIQEIEGEEAKALMDAQMAQQEGKITLFKQLMDYRETLKKRKNEALKEAYDKLHTSNAIADEFVDSAYNELMRLPAADRQKALQAAAAHYNVPLASFAQALADKHKKGTGSGGGYTALELRKLRAAGIDPKNTKVADNFLYNGISPSEDVGTSGLDREVLEEEYGTKKLHSLALALGVKRKKNLSKKNEIDELFSNTKYTAYIQSMLDQGYTIDQIIANQ